MRTRIEEVLDEMLEALAEGIDPDEAKAAAEEAIVHS